MISESLLKYTEKCDVLKADDQLTLKALYQDEREKKLRENMKKLNKHESTMSLPEEEQLEKDQHIFNDIEVSYRFYK